MTLFFSSIVRKTVNRCVCGKAAELIHDEKGYHCSCECHHRKD